jgi:hypothetical protein
LTRDVHGKTAVPLGGLDVLNPAGRSRDSRIIDEHVKPAEAIERLLE